MRWVHGFKSALWVFSDNILNRALWVWRKQCDVQCLGVSHCPCGLVCAVWRSSKGIEIWMEDLKVICLTIECDMKPYRTRHKIPVEFSFAQETNVAGCSEASRKIPTRLLGSLIGPLEQPAQKKVCIISWWISYWKVHRDICRWSFVKFLSGWCLVFYELITFDQFDCLL